ncbi:MAG: FumA C-terminus/TtdB family hydratase beta subunit [Elusimicrobiota bacterium]|jgi:fumarate hydratase subunit beta|nr:FumA C-terminus/TtdB family hydratase beta subunit [Elusimicrobiota bacterium]
MIKLKTPLTIKDLAALKAGREVLLTGEIFAMRDRAHQEFLKEKTPPLNLKNQIIYYMGPSPARPGRPVGACGPTTSARMDKYTPQILTKTGIIGIIGKGARAARAYESMRGKAVYFITYGGLGALLAKSVRECKPVLYPRFGAEAVFKLRVKDMPLIVAADLKGNITGGL